MTELKIDRALVHSDATYGIGSPTVGNESRKLIVIRLDAKLPRGPRNDIRSGREGFAAKLFVDATETSPGSRFAVRY